MKSQNKVVRTVTLWLTESMIISLFLLFTKAVDN